MGATYSATPRYIYITVLGVLQCCEAIFSAGWEWQNRGVCVGGGGGGGGGCVYIPV